METAISINPARRVVILYFLAVLAVLSLLFYALDYLHRLFGLDSALVTGIWGFAALLGFVATVYSFLWRLTSTYSVSSECAASTIGILSKSHIRISMNRIVDYRVLTPLLQRVLGLGSLYIDNAGGEHLIMREISRQNIALVTARLDELLNRDQQKRAGLG